MSISLDGIKQATKCSGETYVVNIAGPSNHLCGQDDVDHVVKVECEGPTETTLILEVTARFRCKQCQALESEG